MSQHRRLHHALILLTGATVAVFLVMSLVTMPALERHAGMPFFDRRLTGYDKPTAQKLVTDLGPVGTRLYKTVQLPIDSAFVALFFVTACCSLLLLARRLSLPAFVVAIAMTIAFLGGCADLVENASVSEMLSIGAERIDDELVMTGSISTVIKFACDGAVVTIIGITAIFLTLHSKHR